MLTKVAILVLDVYRYAVSPILGQCCRFYPSCSEFSRVAIERHGLGRGLWLTIRRVARCNPWHCGGHDPVP